MADDTFVYLQGNKNTDYLYKIPLRERTFFYTAIYQYRNKQLKNFIKELNKGFSLKRKLINSFNDARQRLPKGFKISNPAVFVTKQLQLYYGETSEVPMINILYDLLTRRDPDALVLKTVITGDQDISFTKRDRGTFTSRSAQWLSGVFDQLTSLVRNPMFPLTCLLSKLSLINTGEVTKPAEYSTATHTLEGNATFGDNIVRVRIYDGSRVDNWWLTHDDWIHLTHSVFKTPSTSYF